MSLLLFLALLYGIFTLALWVIWLRIPTYIYSASSSRNLPFISVIVPVRNEADHLPALLNDLSQQTYLSFEVIVADDSSTDATLALAQAYSKIAPFQLTLLPLSDVRTASPKKRAITQSIDLARGQLIVTTDGDCRVGPRWLETLAGFYAETGAKLISGPVTFLNAASSLASTGFTAMQTVEFASLIGSGACTIAIGRPTMCNGANLCYEKAVFQEVGGFSGVDHIASGDDELLMHKIARQYPTGVRFLKSTDAIVRTVAHHNIRSFYNQRKRWASKWRAYESYWPSLLAIFIFISNAIPLVVIVGWLVGCWPANMIIITLLIKVLPEILFLRQILVFLQKNRTVPWIVPTALIYPFYAVFFGLVAQGKGYQWKGRKLS